MGISVTFADLGLQGWVSVRTSLWLQRVPHGTNLPAVSLDGIHLFSCRQKAPQRATARTLVSSVSRPSSWHLSNVLDE